MHPENNQSPSTQKKMRHRDEQGQVVNTLPINRRTVQHYHLVYVGEGRTVDARMRGHPLSDSLLKVTSTVLHQLSDSLLNYVHSTLSNVGLSVQS